ncbi:MAG: DUF1643 domain-containing protein [Leptolyngbyaceae cyanobacterium bins.59]|nr:DUF1643 domain-containing protein [Leptolyngbyaceae cyanobacterium bins.59]
MKRSAEFDETGTYRYSLHRQWNLEAPDLGFIMLNPSTADADRDDPTIRRCIQFAESWGYGSLEVVNLFAYRATHPKVLLQAPDPVGPENDRYLLQMIDRTQTVIVAWGNRGVFQNRSQDVLTLLKTLEKKASDSLYCLGLTRARQPRHPLYIKRNNLPLRLQAAYSAANPILNLCIRVDTH